LIFNNIQQELCPSFRAGYCTADVD